MKEKQAYQKILNYLLFEDLNTPNFSNGFTNLSESFTGNNKPGASFEESVSLEMNSLFSSILIKLDIDDRELIFKNILDDRKCYDGLLFIFSLEVEKHFKNNSFDIHSEFMKMMNYYVSNNKLNDYIVIYFKLYFTDLYEEKFNQKTQISEQEYMRILEKFTNKKSSID